MRACRTCLSRYDLSPLFGDSSFVNFRSDQLFLATGVKIVYNDGLPQSACRSCIKTISRTLELRELSSKVDRMLRNIVKHDVDIKIEQDDILANDFDDNNTKNNVSNIVGSSKMISNNIASNHNGTLRSNQYEYEKNNDNKESHQIDIDESCNNITLNTEEHIDVKPKLKKRDEDKFEINIKSRNVTIETRNYKDMDNDSSLDDVPLAAYEGTADAKPLIEIHAFKEEIDEYDSDNKSSNNKDITNLNFEVSFDVNESKAVSNRNDRSNINNKTNTDVSKEIDSTNKNNRLKKSNVNNIIFEDNTSDFDADSGKLCNLRLEDYISSKDIDELFNDADVFEKYYGKTPNTTLERPRGDQSRLESKINMADEEKRCNNYFVHMMMRKNSKHPKGDIGIPHMTPLNNNTRRNKGLDERKMKWKSDKKMIQMNEKHQKLLSLAVTPYDPKGPVQCKLCHKRLQSVANFRSHAKTHFEPEFTCELQNCGKRFNSRNHMYYHQQRRHGREKRLGCEQCEFRAVDRLALRNHERAEHTGERPYVCNECGAAFRMRNNIIQHMTIHFGVRNIQCELCPALFTRRSQLWTHQNSVHFLTYTYHCYLCPETYKGLAPVKKHLLAIHGVPQDQQLKIQCVKTRKNDTANTSGLSEVPQNNS